MAMRMRDRYTVAEVLAMPDDGQRRECVAGELLVTPAPTFVHQDLLGRLSFALHGYLAREPVARLLVSPADLVFGDDTLVQPDLFAVPLEDAKRGWVESWPAIRQLLLAVEVVSPSSGRADRFIKRRLYQEQGVPVYWCVDPVGQQVEVWTPEAKRHQVERDTLRWLPAGAAEAFTLPVAELFRPL